ncbi:hypothetical protein V8C86DRAFT_2457913 [Haematococcus lacustris]
MIQTRSWSLDLAPLGKLRRARPQSQQRDSPPSQRQRHGHRSQSPRQRLRRQALGSQALLLQLRRSPCHRHAELPCLVQQQSAGSTQRNIQALQQQPRQAQVQSFKKAARNRRRTIGLGLTMSVLRHSTSEAQTVLNTLTGPNMIAQTSSTGTGWITTDLTGLCLLCDMTMTCQVVVALMMTASAGIMDSSTCMVVAPMTPHPWACAEVLGPLISTHSVACMATIMRPCSHHRPLAIPHHLSVRV